MKGDAFGTASLARAWIHARIILESGLVERRHCRTNAWALDDLVCVRTGRRACVAGREYGIGWRAPSIN